MRYLCKMFKQLFILSGVLAVGITAVVYLRYYQPKVDVTEMDPIAISEVENGTVRYGDVLLVSGKVVNSGKDIFGKKQLLLASENDGQRIHCAMTPTESGRDVSVGDVVQVKGVLDMRTDTLLTLKDCIFIKVNG